MAGYVQTYAMPNSPDNMYYVNLGLSDRLMRTAARSLPRRGVGGAERRGGLDCFTPLAEILTVFFMAYGFVIGILYA